MILSDREIKAALDHGHVIIRPRPDENAWTSTAIDLTLADGLFFWRVAASASGVDPKVRPFGKNFHVRKLMADNNFGATVPIDPKNGYELQPRAFVLGFTHEVVYLPNRSRIAARVEGKSSLARLGVGVHVTAPTIHAGFGFRDGMDEQEQGSPIQLEIFNLGDLHVILDVGMPICQLILEEVREAPEKGYRGKFNDQTGFST